MNKKLLLGLAVASSIALTACEKQEPPVSTGNSNPPSTPETDECPRSDGQPCK